MSPTARALFDRVEIWRTEVAASPVSCACSRPCMRPAGFRESLHESIAKFKIGSSSLATGEQGPSRPPLSSVASGSGQIRRPPQQETASDNCAICGLPVDGAVYRWVGFDGFGLVRPRRKSSKRAHPPGADEEEKEGKGNLLMKKVSRVFQRSQSLGGNEPIEPTDMHERTAAKPPKTPKTPKKPKASMATSVKPANPVPWRRTNSTNMYHPLREDTVMVDGGGEESIGVISDGDEDGKKPKIGIEKSASRLRRAQQLLEKRWSN
ncbi:hypothetical protein F4802DRAFT_601213 [Xylaria palmicola]|nr:hypothetical protein F4802DRAFT_601213 [Xylaria palmicola]